MKKLHEIREKLLGEDSETKKQHDKGKLTARERINLLLDPDSFVELDPYVEHRFSSLGMDKRKRMGDGVVTGSGSIGGRSVFIYSQDFSFMGGSTGETHTRKISRVFRLAAKNGVPVIGFLDSGGARIQEGIASLMGLADIFRANVFCSGVVPQIAVIAGPTAGGAVYSPALMDFIFMVRGISYSFITGPRVIKEVTGEVSSFEELGGADVHSSVSGVATFAFDSEVECCEAIRRLLHYIPSNNLDDPPSSEPLPPMEVNFEDILPIDSRKVYDIRIIIDGIVDQNSLFEIQPDFAPNVVVGFAKMEGQSIGIVATQPAVMAGCMTIDSSDKIARFVRFCDAFYIPIITLQDVPGYLPGVQQEHGGIIRHGAKVIYAYAEATVPKITIILRKSFGGAHIALGSKLLGTDFVYALPQAEIAVMGAEGAVEIVYRREISENSNKKNELIDVYKREFSDPFSAAMLGYIDDVIEPMEIRPRVINSLKLLSKKRARIHLPKRHGNMPV